MFIVGLTSGLWENFEQTRTSFLHWLSVDTLKPYSSLTYGNRLTLVSETKVRFLFIDV